MPRLGVSDIGEIISLAESAPSESRKRLGVNLHDAVKSLIEKTCGMEKFADDAVADDGRGHFLSNYDGEESEVEVCGETFYIYRTD